MAPVTNPSFIYQDKYAQYIIGTNFVALAVDRLGFPALILLAENPPSTLEDLSNPNSYIDFLTTLQEH